MIGRFGAVVMVVASMTFAGCATSPAQPKPQSGPVLSTPAALDEDGAIRAVLASGLAASPTFPGHAGRIACTLAAALELIAGTCQTSAARTGGLFVVTLTESWDARKFHYQSDPGYGQLSASWRYGVDGVANVTFLGRSGNFPPEEAK